MANPDNSERPNVTKVINATIVINAPQDDLPTSMVAIVNPTANLKKEPHKPKPF